MTHTSYRQNNEHLYNIITTSITPLSFAHHSSQGEEEGEDAMDLSGVDVWAADFDPTTVFDAESLKEITDFFTKNAGDMDGQIRYSTL